MGKMRFEDGYQYSGLLEREGVRVIVRRAADQKLWQIMDGERLVCEAGNRVDLERCWGELSDVKEMMPAAPEEPKAE